jgi:hypothetical protein
MYFKKYYVSELLMTIVFAFISIAMNAQNLSTELDTLGTDTTITIEAIDNESEYDVEETFDQNYFLERSAFSSDSLSWRKIPDTIVQHLKNDPDFWYADHVFRKNEPRKRSGAGRKLLEVVLWMIIIGGFAAFIMWYLANSNIGLFQKKNRAIAFEESEEETEDIFAINYQKEIDKALSNGNYRLAIRLMYLRLLRDLSQKNIIRYKHERTNFDYLLQLSSTSYYHDFFRVTRNYEYSWYGHFEVDKGKFDIIKSDFSSFERKINSY